MAAYRRTTASLTQQEVDRFWSKIDVRGPNECWPWTAKARKNNGYGSFSIKSEGFAAHRVAFFLYHGIWPDVARHTCDNPLCCNILHILNGTQADNVADMIRRGRKGPSNTPIKFSDSAIQAVRDAPLGSICRLAHTLGMNPSYAHYLRKGKYRKPN